MKLFVGALIGPFRPLLHRAHEGKADPVPCILRDDFRVKA